MYQKVILVGNLGTDPEMRYMPDGRAVANFSMATNRRYGQTDETTWFRVTVWGKQAETVNEYLRKGRTVLVEGRLTPDGATGGPRVWTDKQGVARASFEVTAESVRFIGGAHGADERDELFPTDAEAIPF